MASSILSLMGIDVWTLRPALPSDAEAEADETTQPVPQQNAHSPDQAVSVASLALLRQQLVKGASPGQQSKARDRVRTGPTAAADAEARDSAFTAKGAAATSAEKVDEFLFLFIDYTQHSVVISLPFGSARLPDDYRFFADDISRALTGATESFARASDMQMRDMSWPMLRAAHIHHSAEDARALVLQKVKLCKNLVIAFGDLPEKYLSSLKPEIPEKRLIYAAAIEQYFKTPALKRQLWEQLKPFVACLDTRRKE